jgi:hypothetical protein
MIHRTTQSAKAFVALVICSRDCLEFATFAISFHVRNDGNYAKRENNTDKEGQLEHVDEIFAIVEMDN